MRDCAVPDCTPSGMPTLVNPIARTEPSTIPIGFLRPIRWLAGCGRPLDFARSHPHAAVRRACLISCRRTRRRACGARRRRAPRDAVDVGAFTAMGRAGAAPARSRRSRNDPPRTHPQAARLPRRSLRLFFIFALRNAIYLYTPRYKLQNTSRVIAPSDSQRGEIQHVYLLQCQIVEATFRAAPWHRLADGDAPRLSRRRCGGRRSGDCRRQSVRTASVDGPGRICAAGHRPFGQPLRHQGWLRDDDGWR